MAIYYVSTVGSDSNDGLSKLTPWQTAARVVAQLNTVGGIPGDEYLFEGGETFPTTERLAILSSVDADSEPVRISSYGPRGRATILLTENTEGLIIFDSNAIVEDINIIREDGYATATKQGIVAFGFASSPTTAFTKTIIRRCNISGFYEGISIAIFFLAGVYKNVLIQDCYVYDCKRTGILSYADRSADPNSYLSLTVDNCKVEKIYGVAGISSGNLIVLGSTEDSVIKNCVGKGVAGASLAANAFWFYDSYGGTLEDCVASEMQCTGPDGGGGGVDIDCSNITVQRNYFYNCEGPGLLCLNGKGNIFRYNVLVNCCLDTNTSIVGAINYFGFTSDSLSADLTSSAQIYNNLIVMPPGEVNPGISVNHAEDKALIANNIVVIQNASANALELPTFTTGSATIQGNCYWDTTAAPSFKRGSTTYSGLAAWQAIGYEKVGSTNVGQVTDPDVALTFGSYRLKNFVPQSATVRDFEPPILPLLDYDLLKLYDVSGFRVFEPQLGPFVLEPNLSNLTVSGGSSTGDITTIAGSTPAATALRDALISTGTINANVTQISGDATAADNLEALLDGTGGVTLAGNLSGTVGTVTTLTNLPAAPSNWLTAAAIATNAIDADALSTDAVTEIQSGLATSAGLTAATTGLSTLTAAQVWNHATRELTALPALPTDWITAAAISSGAVTKLATGIEAAMLNDGDGQALIDAIVDFINTNLDLPALELAAIADSVWARLTSIGPPDGSYGALLISRLDATITSRSTFDPATTSVTASNMRGTDGAITSLAGIATSANVTAAQTAIITRGDAAWTTATGFSTYDGSDTPGTATLLARLTAIRAGHLDTIPTLSTLGSSDIATALNSYGAARTSDVQVDVTVNPTPVTGGFGDGDRTHLTEVWQKQNLDPTTPVTRAKNGDVVTETFGNVTVTHTSNGTDTVTSTRST